MKIFISLPISNRPYRLVCADIDRVTKTLKEMFGEGITIVHNVDCPELPDAGRLYYLGEAIKKMDGVNLVYFVDGWENAAGCKVEHFVALTYHIRCFYENREEKIMLAKISSANKGTYFNHT